MHQLSGLDAAFLNLEKASAPLHVGSAIIVDPSTAEGDFGYDTVRALIAQRLDKVPPFRWKLVEVPFGLDHPYWIEDRDFDLEFHLRRIAVPPPGDERSFAEIVARIFARPLDRSRPLWEVYVIEGLQDGYVAIMSKTHHAAIDGVSGAELLTALLDVEPVAVDPDAAADLDVWGEARPGIASMLVRSAAGAAKQPWRMARAGVRFARSLPVLGNFAEMALPSSVRRGHDGGVMSRPNLAAPPTPFNTTVSPHRRFAFGSLSLDEVKAVKDAHGATVNDVVMTVCAGMLRRWLLDRDALPERPLQAMVPVSVRSADDRGELGNRVTAIIATLATHLDDPLERLAYTREAMTVAKEGDALPADVLTDFTQFATPAVAARAARLATRFRLAERVGTPFNVIISNVPGPQFPLYYASAEIRHLYPISAIYDGTACNITVMSYQGRMDFGLVADREVVPNLWEMMDLLHDELAQLTATTGDGSGASEAAGTDPSEDLPHGA